MALRSGRIAVCLHAFEMTNLANGPAVIEDVARLPDR